MELERKDSSFYYRDEDLNCIFNTIALFLDHQNFTRTSQIFRDECKSKGLNEKLCSHENLKLNNNSKNVKYEEIYQKNFSKTNPKIPSRKESYSVVFTFKDNEILPVPPSSPPPPPPPQPPPEDEHSNEKTSAMNSCKNSTTKSKISIQDYLELKQKFRELQDQHLKLMSELDDKTKYLDEIIPFLLKEQIGDSEKTNSSSLENVGKNVKFLNVQEGEKTSSEYEIESTKLHENVSVESVAGTTLCSLTKSTDCSLIDLGDHQEFIPDSQQKNEIDLLFKRKKSKSTRSAPVLPNVMSGYKGNSIENQCFSLPLSPRKHDSNKYHELDFSTLKRDLISGTLERKMLILQALRWRLTKCSDNERDHVIQSYISNDILDLRRQLTMLEVPDGTKGELIDPMSRLINTIASLKEGRDYLCSRKITVQFIMGKLKKHFEKHEKIPIYFEMLVATLQKLSIRKEQRKIMIEMGLLANIFNLLSNRKNELSSYCLEYTCALFMNLCLEDEAKKECVSNSSVIIKIFLKLLDEIQNIYMPYITGALYSILSEEKIKIEAIKQQMDVKIKEMIENTKDKFLTKQMEFILRSRFSEENSNSDDCNGNEPIDEVDMLEPELDQNDTLLGRLQGEYLLKAYEICKNQNDFEEPQESSTTIPQKDENRSKIDTSRIKFDAEVETSFNSDMRTGNRGDGIEDSVELCNCLGSAKYDCGCYEAIKRSVDEVEVFSDNEENSSKLKSGSTLFPKFDSNKNSSDNHKLKSNMTRKKES